MSQSRTFGAALRGAAIAALLGASSAAHATWTFTGVDGGAANTSVTANPSSDPSLTISGVSTSGSAGTWRSESLLYYSGNGLAMASDGSTFPNHALDNNGRVEGVLLRFSANVALTSIGIGYRYGDADISLFRYTGAGTPTLVGTGASLSSMNAAGWSLVGNYGDLGVDTTNPYTPVNAGGASSSWWLISAYMSNYGAGTTGWVDQGDDYFKLYAVAGRVSAVPEPSSIAMTALGLGLLVAMRRRKAASA